MHKLLSMFFLCLSMNLVAADFSYDDLEKLISDNKLTSLDQFISKLPKAVIKNLGLVYDSHALNTYLITPETPRMVFFNDDGTLLFSMTKNPGAEAVNKGLDRLEVLRFDEKSKLFETREIIFDGKIIPGKKTNVVVNSPVCLSCHGQNPHPILQDYNTWPGFYGSFSQDGLSKAGTLEYKWLSKFLVEAKDKTRYKDLDLSEFESSWAGITYSATSQTPVKLLGTKLERLMITRAAKKLSMHSSHLSIRPLLEYIGAQSDICNTPEERVKKLYNEWRKTLNTDTEKKLIDRIDQQIKDDYKVKVTQFSKFNEVELTEYDVRGVFSIPYVLAIIGFDPYYKIDQVAFRNQLFLLEVVFKKLKFTTEDISTFPTNPTLGIFHLRKGVGQNSDYFSGLVQAISPFDANITTRFSNCEERFDMALGVLKSIEVPEATSPGVLYQ